MTAPPKESASLSLVFRVSPQVRRDTASCSGRTAAPSRPRLLPQPHWPHSPPHPVTTLLQGQSTLLPMQSGPAAALRVPAAPGQLRPWLAGLWKRSGWLGAGGLGLTPPYTSQLCDLGPILEPPSASVSSSLEQGQ